MNDRLIILRGIFVTTVFTILVNVSAYHKGQMITGAKARTRGWKQRLQLHELKPELEQKSEIFLCSEGQRHKLKHRKAKHAGLDSSIQGGLCRQPPPVLLLLRNRTVTYIAKGALHIASNDRTDPVKSRLVLFKVEKNSAVFEKVMGTI